MGNIMELEGEVKIVFDRGIRLVIVIAVLLAVFYCGRLTLVKLINRYSKDKDNPQVATLLTILKSTWKYFMLLIGFIAVLNVFGMSITANSLLAAAGAGGLILGIGAQDFVKDIVNGFSIIMENQYSVGDYISVNNISGTVVSMSLRTTKIIGDNKETLTVPNSSVGMVINYSKQAPRVICSIYIQEEAQLQTALKALQGMAENFKSPYAADSARLLGVTDMHSYCIELGVSCLCVVGHILDLRYEMNKAMAMALLEAGVPFINENVPFGGDINVL